MNHGSANTTATTNFILDVEPSPTNLGSLIPGTDAGLAWLLDKLSTETISALTQNTNLIAAVNANNAAAANASSAPSALNGMKVKRYYVASSGTKNFTISGAQMLVVTTGGTVATLSAAIVSQNSSGTVRIAPIVEGSAAVIAANGTNGLKVTTTASQVYINVLLFTGTITSVAST